ncbi:MAG: DUF6273 domain-containing protein [Faecalibacterium sp.]
MANVKLGTKAVGSIVKIKVNGASKDFIVVQQGNPNTGTYDSSCAGTWLLMKDIYTTSTFGNNNSYKDSSIHTYLNGTFYNLIDSNIRAAIKQVKIPYQNGTGSGGSLATGSNGLSTKVFLLSGYEVGWTTSDNGYFPKDGVRLAYFGNSSSGNSKRIAYNGSSAAIWWLRSPRTSDTAASGASTPVAPATTTGTATPVVFAPLSFFPLHSWSLTTARSVSTLHLPSARTAQLLARRTRPLRGNTPSPMPTATA